MTTIPPVTDLLSDLLKWLSWTFIGLAIIAVAVPLAGSNFAEVIISLKAAGLSLCLGGISFYLSRWFSLKQRLIKAIKKTKKTDFD